MINLNATFGCVRNPPYRESAKLSHPLQRRRLLLWLTLQIRQYREFCKKKIQLDASLRITSLNTRLEAVPEVPE
jgi:hypothetical protein